MPVSFHTLLLRNKISFDEFIKKNNVKSYSDVLEFCKKRNYLPPLIDEYNLVANPKKKDDTKKTQNKRGISSSSQKKKQTRDSNKAIKSSQPVSGSDERRKNWRMECIFHRY